MVMIRNLAPIPRYENNSKLMNMLTYTFSRNKNEINYKWNTKYLILETGGFSP